MDLIPKSIQNLLGGLLTGNRALNVQGYVESNVKNGLQFSASSYFTGLTVGENLDTIVITGSKPVIIKAQYTAIENGADVLISWYKNPTYTGGSNLSDGIFNQTDILPQPTTVQLFGVAPTDSAAGNYAPNDATKPNVTATGTIIQPLVAILGSEGIGGSVTSRNASIGLDHILDSNSVYLFRRTATGDTEAIFGYSTWYEGTPDLPLP